MKRAEALCKQRKNRAYEWSPTLAKMGGRICYWKMRKKMIKDTYTIDTTERQKQLGINDSGSQEADYINKQLRLAWSELHQTQKRAGLLRQTHLEDLATYRGEEGNTNAAKELKNFCILNK